MTRFCRSKLLYVLLAGAGIGAAVALFIKARGDHEESHKAYGDPDGEVSDGSTASFVD